MMKWLEELANDDSPDKFELNLNWRVEMTETYIVASENDRVINSIHRSKNAAQSSLDERKRYAARMGGWTPFKIFSIDEKMSTLKKMSFGEIARDYNLVAVDALD